MANSWGYENLDDDLAELNRNLLNLNDKGIIKSQNLKNKKLEKSEKKLKNLVAKLSGNKKK